MPRDAGAPRVAVIGAGPAGLAAADRLAQAGADVELFEASGRVGGLAGSIRVWDRDVDLGPHIFSGGPPAAVALWNELLGDHHCVPLRRAIAMSGAVVDYPPGPAALLRALPARQVAPCVAAAVRARLTRQRGDEAPDAAGWVAARYGRPLYEAVMQPYIAKLWGLGGDHIDASFARALLGGSGGAAARRGAGGPCQAQRARSFAYPVGATGAVWERLATRIRAHAPIHLGARVDGVQVHDGRVVAVSAGGDQRAFDHVISSMPLHRLVRAIPELAGSVEGAVAGLRTRHAVVVHLRVADATPLPYAWAYVFDPRLAVGRVTDTRTWGIAGPSESEGIIALEYWCGDRDAVWTDAVDRVAARAGAELTATGLLPGARVIEGRVTRLRGALPIPDVGYRERLDAIAASLAAVRGLTTIGRHGSFAFNSIAESIAEGIKAADAVLASGAADHRPAAGR